MYGRMRQPLGKNGMTDTLFLFFFTFRTLWGSIIVRIAN